MIKFNYSNAAREATIEIDGTIGFDPFAANPEANTKEGIKAQLKEISNIDANVINVNINSFGGDANDGISIHDALAMHSATVNVRITGRTASAATIIAMAGDSIEMSENAQILIHKAWTFVAGNANDMDELKDDLSKYDDVMANMYSKRTMRNDAARQMTPDQALELMNRNNGNGEWLTPDEAFEFGLIDSVFEPMSVAAQIPSDKLAAYGLPAIPNNKIKNMSDLNTTPEMSEDIKEIKSGVSKLVDNVKDLFKTTKAEAEVTEEVVEVDLEAVNAELTTELETLKADLEAKTTEIESLLSNKEEIDNTITALNARVDELSKLPISKEVVAETAPTKSNSMKGEELYNFILNNKK